MAISPGEKVKQQRPQKIPWGEGKNPLLWGNNMQACQLSTSACLHLIVLIQGGFCTEFLAQLFRDVFWRLPVTALIKYLGKGKKTLISIEREWAPPIVAYVGKGSWAAAKVGSDISDKDLRGPLTWDGWKNYLYPGPHLLDHIYVISTCYRENGMILYIIYREP